MTHFQFPKQITGGDVVVRPDYVMVSCGWTVHIPGGRALQYAEQGPSRAAQGFRLHGNYMILTHRGCSVSLPEETGWALIEAIMAAHRR